ncbi:hypothetical protein PEC18_05570 [Paucibacter sp. O1-1]|nr:hypothetical protein [Paucibacter sp. O1-1]MDA3825339.1 hypothetical protein [Paucibacter sp. O1-1]
MATGSQKRLIAWFILTTIHFCVQIEWREGYSSRTHDSRRENRSLALTTLRLARPPTNEVRVHVSSRSTRQQLEVFWLKTKKSACSRIADF